MSLKGVLCDLLTVLLVFHWPAYAERTVLPDGDGVEANRINTTGVSSQPSPEAQETLSKLASLLKALPPNTTIEATRRYLLSSGISENEIRSAFEKLSEPQKDEIQKKAAKINGKSTLAEVRATGLDGTKTACLDGCLSVIGVLVIGVVVYVGFIMPIRENLRDLACANGNERACKREGWWSGP